MSWDVDETRADKAQPGLSQVEGNPDNDAFAGPWWWHYAVLLPGFVVVLVLLLGKGLPA